MALWGRKSKSAVDEVQPKAAHQPIDIPTIEAIGAVAPASAPARAAAAPREQARQAAAAPPSAPEPRAPEPQSREVPAREAATPALDEQVLKRKAAEAKQMLLGFGEVVSVLMKSPQFKALSLAQIEELVVPAVVTGQFIVAEAQSRSNGLVSPVATALWAVVSKEVDERLSNDLATPVRLAPSEWRSGDIPWLIVVAGDKRVVHPMLRNVQTTLLKGRALKTRIRDADGRVAAGPIPLAAEAAPASPPSGKPS